MSKEKIELLFIRDQLENIEQLANILSAVDCLQRNYRVRESILGTISSIAMELQNCRSNLPTQE